MQTILVASVVTVIGVHFIIIGCFLCVGISHLKQFFNQLLVFVANVAGLLPFHFMIAFSK